MDALNLKGEIILKQGREQSVLRRHPWVFSGAIARYSPGLDDGCWVSVRDYKGNTLGHGHYQKGSITVRILDFNPVPIENLYAKRLQDAWNARLAAGIITEQTNCFRLVHGEGDQLPGLIIDLYDTVAVIQAHSYGMAADKNLLAAAILETIGHKISSIYYKDTLTTEGSYLHGNTTVPLIVSEHGNHFLVDWEHGQKTGFFLDQRENRAALAQFCQGKNVLNTFCYSGGFSVYALKGGAACVHSVDSSNHAIELCVKNVRLNGFDTDLHRCYVSDTFEFLNDPPLDYDVIILDPPAFAKHKDARHQAVRGYQRLNTEAMRSIKPGGIIFTFSCSQVVDRQLFYDTVMSAAIQSGRVVRVLTHLSQPADHPVSAFHPEGAYLKGLVLYIE